MLRQFSGGITIDPGFGALLKMGSGGVISVARCVFLFGFLMVSCSGWYQHGKNETKRFNCLGFLNSLRGVCSLLTL